MNSKVAPRIFYWIPATQAPVVAVFRRGPSDWSHVGRWDFAQSRYQPGVWLAGRTFRTAAICPLTPAAKAQTA